MQLPERIAHFITHYPRRVWAVLGILISLASVVIWLRAEIKSDILDMLPGHFESVGIYKLADREFSAARDLVVGLLADSDEVKMDDFAAHVSLAAAKEPWVVRVMNGSPLEAPVGLEEIRAVALPLMLNQDDVSPLISTLQPEAIRARLGRLRAKVESGIGVSQAELEYDPLGIVFPVLKAVQPGRAFLPEDPRFRLLLIHTRQSDLSEAACNETMRKYEDFKKRVIASWPASNGPVPQMLCTGRTPYVSEMAGKLKGDIFSTVNSSILLVALTFFAGFRRWRPLRAMVETLVVTCVLGVACGALFFGALNMITVGLCAILIGLGVDFAMVLYAFYIAETDKGASHEAAIAAALRAHGSGICAGAITTAAAFLCLLWSGSPGYQQLGALIASGILIAALAMMTLFWFFLGIRLTPIMRRIATALVIVAIALGIGWVAANFSVLWTPTSMNSILMGIGIAAGTMIIAHVLSHVLPRLPGFARRGPWRILAPSLLVFCGLAASSFTGAKVPFDLNPRSLEPLHSNAGHAFRTIVAHTNPGKIEPILAVIKADSQEELSASWRKAEASWQKFVGEGRLFTSMSRPAGLVTSPARMSANAEKIGKAVDLSASRAAFDAAVIANDFTPQQFAASAGVFDALAAAVKGELNVVDWKRNLPQSSAWWFLIDGSLSRERPLGLAHLKPARAPESEADVAALRTALEVPGVTVGLSGWSLTLAELATWSAQKISQLTVLMLSLNVVLLTILLRQWRPVAITMVGLTLAVAAMFATLKWLGISLNLFNVLAFPLVLGVGVDYGIYIAIAMRSKNATEELGTLMKPLLLSGLTTAVGFGSLAWAENPALRGLGILCGVGVGWCLIATFLIVLPACILWVKPSESADT